MYVGGGGGMGTHAGVTGYPAPVVDPSATQSMNPGGLQSMNPAADPFPRKGPSGPRRAGEGVEEVLELMEGYGMTKDEFKAMLVAAGK